MRRLQPRLQRLLRALLACWALLVVFEPPAAVSASWEPRALSAWLVPGAVASASGERSGSALSGPSASSESRASLTPEGRSAAARSARALRAPYGVSALPAPSPRAGAAPYLNETALPRLDGRYLYLEVQSLLC